MNTNEPMLIKVWEYETERMRATVEEDGWILDHRHGEEPINVYKATLEDKQTHMRAEFSSLGASLTHLFTPDAKGELADVVLGFDDWCKYEKNTPYMGAICGRFANRIKGGAFTLAGENYTLAINNGGNALHGGLLGTSHRFWSFDEMAFETQNEDLSASVAFEINLADGEEGYPGAMNIKVLYTLTSQGALHIDYEALSDADTVINLTNHTYFNLSGEGNGLILQHQIKLNAEKYLELDAQNCPTGEIKTVENTPYDFREFRTLQSVIFSDFEQVKHAKGIDTPFCVSGHLNLPSAILRDPKTQRTVTLFTDRPCVQIYTGNWLGGESGKQGHLYADYSGVALEAQNYPAAPNYPHFPSAILKANEFFKSRSTYLFSVEK